MSYFAASSPRWSHDLPAVPFTSFRSFHDGGNGVLTVIVAAGPLAVGNGTASSFSRACGYAVMLTPLGVADAAIEEAETQEFVLATPDPPPLTADTLVDSATGYTTLYPGALPIQCP